MLYSIKLTVTHSTSSQKVTQEKGTIFKHMTTFTIKTWCLVVKLHRSRIKIDWDIIITRLRILILNNISLVNKLPLVFSVEQTCFLRTLPFQIQSCQDTLVVPSYSEDKILCKLYYMVEHGNNHGNNDIATTILKTEKDW